MNITTAAERLGAARNLSADEFLAQAVRAIEDCSYPSPECLLPDEIAHFRLHNNWPPDATDEIERHLRDCLACGSLLEASTPNAKLLSEFVDLAISSGCR